MTIHEMPAAAWEAWNIALGSVPVEVTAEHHRLGIYTERPLGAIVLENHRFVPEASARAGELVLFIRGHAFRRGPA